MKSEDLSHYTNLTKLILLAAKGMQVIFHHMTKYVLILSGLATQTVRTNSVLMLSELTHSCFTTKNVRTNYVQTLYVLTLSSFSTQTLRTNSPTLSPVWKLKTVQTLSIMTQSSFPLRLVLIRVGTVRLVG